MCIYIYSYYMLLHFFYIPRSDRYLQNLARKLKCRSSFHCQHQNEHGLALLVSPVVACWSPLAPCKEKNLSLPKEFQKYNDATIRHNRWLRACRWHNTSTQTHTQNISGTIIHPVFGNIRNILILSVLYNPLPTLSFFLAKAAPWTPYYHSIQSAIFEDLE